MKKRLGNLLLIRSAKRYGAASGGTWAVAIAWNALFAFFPIILAITTVLALVFGSQGLGSTLDQQIASAIPGQQGSEIISALHSFKHAAGPMAIVSFVGLLWSGSSLFSSMDQGLDALYPTKQRNFVRQKLMALLMIAVFTVLIVPATASASLLSIITKLPNVPSFLSSGPVALAIQVVFGLIDGIVLFAAIYLIVPNRPHKFREILPGAIVAGVLFEAFTLLFPLYFKLQHGFTTYGTTFALFFLLMTFAFWMAQIIMLGGAVNAELHPPEPGAFPRAGSSISPNAQTEADRADLDGSARRDAPQRERAGASRR
ncbi:MAG: YihY/virulence factor BrkB family protein [Candidatus Dormibacteraeota bacterium]|nr:YihY/virulence factor BrkB family protein [Candidatus Dormibacteraeota bacterium]MBV9525195.1 YihY/virulence factor BrkB family protein [Candidatus Dormibacteraeota bacterium]